MGKAGQGHQRTEHGHGHGTARAHSALRRDPVMSRQMRASSRTATKARPNARARIRM